MDKLNLEVTLSRLLMGLWPCSVDKMVFCNDKEYPLFVAEASKVGVKPRCAAAHFYVLISYALAGFETRDGGWKAIFDPFIQVCSLCNGLETIKLGDVGDDTLQALLPLLGVEPELCIDMPRMEKVHLSMVGSDGLIVESQETYWRMADKRYGE